MEGGGVISCGFHQRDIASTLGSQGMRGHLGVAFEWVRAWDSGRRERGGTLGNPTSRSPGQCLNSQLSALAMRSDQEGDHWTRFLLPEPTVFQVLVGLQYGG